MVNRKGHRLLALLLAFTMALAVTGCGKKEASEVSEPAEQSSQGFVNMLPVPDGPSWKPLELEKLSEMAQEKNKLNGDSVGWLHLADTTINDVILWRATNPTNGQPDNNQYYLRRDFEHRYSFEGVYFADFRSTFNGKRDGLITNTIIYGHSMEDDPNGPIFSQLKKYKDPEFAKTHPYIYFSTLEDDMVWEVFAVYFSSTSFFYNTPKFDDAAHFDTIIGGCLERSIYNYEDITVTPDDKILTLSTCCYNIVSTYPNNYRYVIMAKLVDENDKLKDEAKFTENPSPKAP